MHRPKKVALQVSECPHGTTLEGTWGHSEGWRADLGGHWGHSETWIATLGAHGDIQRPAIYFGRPMGTFKDLS